MFHPKIKIEEKHNSPKLLIQESLPYYIIGLTFIIFLYNLLVTTYDSAWTISDRSDIE